jgi:hypothetical protein
MPKLLLFLLICCCALVQTAAPPPSIIPMPPAQAMQLSRQYAAQYLAGNVAAMWPKMTPQMQQALKSEADAKAALDAAFEQIGHESQMLNERVLPVLGTDLMVYTRLSSFEKVPMKMVTTLALDHAGNIAGMSIRGAQNPAESKYLDYKTKTPLRFPLTGEWTIYQGGRSVYDNYHAAYSDERFAYDIVVLHADGTSASGDGSKPEDYYGFAQPVVASGAGRVAVAVDQYDDNPIGKPIKGSPKEGNTIVIDHGNGEFSMYAHLKRGSVKVKAGDEVKPGQLIAQVGNSGNSPVPHLHYHLQTTAEWFHGDGLPTFFQHLVVNGKPASNAEPVRGDVVKAE